MANPSHHHTWAHPNQARYYQVNQGQDLLGDWALLKVWGWLGSRRGRIRNTGPLLAVNVHIRLQTPP